MSEYFFKSDEYDKNDKKSYYEYLMIRNLKCCICKKKYDPTNRNYGWHITKKGFIEQCCFQNMPFKFSSKRVKNFCFINGIPTSSGKHLRLKKGIVP
jgi:hypothetical protein